MLLSKHHLIFLASLYILCLSSVAFVRLLANEGAPAENVESIWSRHTMTGDWGGLRSFLKEHGLVPELY